MIPLKTGGSHDSRLHDFLGLFGFALVLSRLITISFIMFCYVCYVVSNYIMKHTKPYGNMLTLYALSMETT